MRASPRTWKTVPAPGKGESAPAGHEGCGQRCWRDVRETRDAVRFRILFVCTGNVCRSPMAERLTRSAIGPCPAVQVISAGTRAEPGREMTGHARRTLQRFGGDPVGFGSRPLDPELVAAADLVLTATQGHRAESVTMHLAAVTRTFTIAEFGTLARAVSPEGIIRYRDPVRRARALVDEARALRGLVRVDHLDIADPYGRSRLVHQLVGRRIARALAVPLRLLTQAPAS